MSYYHRFAEIEARQVFPGVFRRPIRADQLLMQLVEFGEGGAAAPLHRHPRDQISYILEGEMTWTVAGESRRLTAGDVITVPGGVEHGCTSEGPVKLLEAFYPQY